MTRQANLPSRASSNQPPHENRRSLLEWQLALLPLMSIMLTGLALFFFVASFVQLRELNERISESPTAQLERTIALVDSPVHQTSSEVLRASELQILAALDTYALERRYHQANVLLMSRVWSRYLGFVTGMILALIGSSFILGKMRTDENVAEIASGPVSALFRGTEPGLILAGMGVVLMMTTIIVNHQISTEDAPTFMQVWRYRSLGDESFLEVPQVNTDGLFLSSQEVPGFDGLETVPGPQIDADTDAGGSTQQQP